MCDDTGAKDLTHEIAEELEADVVIEWVAGLVSFGTVVTAGNTVEAFLVSYHPDLVCHLFSCAPSFLFEVVIDPMGFIVICLCSPYLCSTPASISLEGR